MASGFKNPQELGEDTPIFNEKQAYAMNREINKILWNQDNSGKAVEQKEEVKKTSFC